MCMSVESKVEAGESYLTQHTSTAGTGVLLASHFQPSFAERKEKYHSSNDDDM